MGKSRYAPLVKLKKKGLDEAERFLIAANNEAAWASDKLNNAYEVLKSMTLPHSGSVRELAQAKMMIHSQHETIEACKEAVDAARAKQEASRERFKQAMIDYEKFKYLEVQEANAAIRAAKAQEAKLLDEIGILTYKSETI